LTNKNLFTFTNSNDEAECTMNLELKKCEKIEISDETIRKQNTFVVKEINSSYYFQASSIKERNEWLKCIKLQFSNNILIDENEEFDLEQPERSVSIRE
jgi:hypothetical protein